MDNAADTTADTTARIKGVALEAWNQTAGLSVSDESVPTLFLR
jgi:hypothetical protein